MTDSGQQLHRRALFEIPIWSIDLPSVMPFHREMAAEVEDAIDHNRAADPSRVLAHQTADDPFLLPSEGWRLLEAEMNRCFQNLARENFQRWRSGEFHVRRWAIRLGKLTGEEKQRLQRDQIHNHLPALFSTIYYLSIPSELEGQPRGGTRFWNPIGNLMDVTAPRLADIPSCEGRLVVFPSFLDHAPIPIEWDAEQQSRIVVSTDLFYVSGEASGSDRRPISVGKRS